MISCPLLFYTRAIKYFGMKYEIYWAFTKTKFNLLDYEVYYMTYL